MYFKGTARELGAATAEAIGEVRSDQPAPAAPRKLSEALLKRIREEVQRSKLEHLAEG
jgi:hypothetical protein